MLEIIALIYLTRRVGEIAREKGRKAGWFKFMTVVLWFGCEIGGGIVGGVASAVAGWPDAVAYLFALVGAAVGAGLSILIVKTLPVRDAALMQPPPPPPAFG
ncbi:MAG TPA: hypothetical protein VK421_16755 [Pyrinomonadaceae bacterium]|nr:hypothetical protein [Pyrinomonadaceae bacterium]